MSGAGGAISGASRCGRRPYDTSGIGAGRSLANSEKGANGAEMDNGAKKD